MANPMRDYPDSEIEGSLESFGGWCHWIGERPRDVVLALRWKASQGDDLPEELESLAEAVAQFGHTPIEGAVARVQGLEKALTEIAEILGYGEPSPSDNDQIRNIVDSCVKYTGAFGVAETDDAEQRPEA